MHKAIIITGGKVEIISAILALASFGTACNRSADTIAVAPDSLLFKQMGTSGSCQFCGQLKYTQGSYHEEI